MQIYTLNIRKQVLITDSDKLARYVRSLCEQLHLRGQVVISPQSLSINLEGSNEVLTKMGMYLQDQIPLLEDECVINPTSVSLASGLEVNVVHPEHSAFAAQPAV